MQQLEVTPQPSPGIHLVVAFLDALKALDLERALDMLSDDIVYQNVPLPPDRGKRRVARTLRMMTPPLITEFDYTMHQIAETDGVVLSERTDYLRGPVVDLSIWVWGTFEIKNGKIALWRDRADIGAVAYQLATSPLRALARTLRAR
ncbi:MAG TPA: limonene-1,2-epoxide hydrolase family protein [Polyangiales bacterium]|nr:limonene-1,2-epoxide hydrolase family protein [Polyangiales bacterium]